MVEQGGPSAVPAIQIEAMWAIWSAVVVATGLVLLTYGIVVVLRDRRRAARAAAARSIRDTAARVPRQLSAAPTRLALPSALPAAPSARPASGRPVRRPPGGARTPVKVPRQRERPAALAGAPTVEVDAPETAPPDLDGKAPAPAQPARTPPPEQPTRPKGGKGKSRVSTAECVELRRRCEQLRRQAATASAAAARATLAAEQAVERRAHAQRERAAAQEARDAAAAATAEASTAASAEAQRLAEQRSAQDGEGERVTTHAAFAAFRRGDITAEQLREVFRRAEGWTPQQDDLTHEVIRCRAAEADAQRALDFALTTEQVAEELAEEATRLAGQADDEARAAGAAAREVCTAAATCESGRKRRR